ncbi:MAG: TolC family protein [Bacteroidota bacterium]
MKTVITIFIFLSCSIASGQRILTLEESISIAMGESYSIKSAEQSLVSSQMNLEAIKMGLRSSVDLEFDLPRYSRSLSSQFNTTIGTEQFFEVGNTTIEGRLSITQPILFTNGTLSISGSVFGRDQFSGLTGTSRDYFSNVGIRLQQPLFVFNTQAANLDRAEINLEKTQRQYNQAEKDIIYNVTSSFYYLFRSKKNVEITKEKVAQTEISYNTAVNKFKAGLIPEVEMLQLEVDLAASKNELLNAEQLFEEAKNEFKLLIGLNLSEKIDVTADLKYLPVEINTEEAIGNALKHRSDILNVEADITLSKMNIDQVESQSTIRADITANYGINKNDEQFDNIFNNFEDTRSVVMTVSIPVWDWGKNAKEVESAEAGHNLNLLRYQNLKEQIVKEVLSAINKLNSAKARVEVLSKSVDVAVKSYEINLERFKSGNITSFDLSQMQLKLTDSKINSLNAMIDYQIALADLERKTFKEY